jgi:hypothetical protein
MGIESSEADKLRSRGFCDLVAAIGEDNVGAFYADMLAQYHQGECDEAEVGYWLNLLPDHTRLSIYPHEGKTLKVDHYSDDWVPGSMRYGDAESPVISRVPLGDAENRFERIVPLEATVSVDTGGWSRSDVVELTFNEANEPDFRLRFFLPATG